MKERKGRVDAQRLERRSNPEDLPAFCHRNERETCVGMLRG